jgi:hypothetical protein
MLLPVFLSGLRRHYCALHISRFVLPADVSHCAVRTDRDSRAHETDVTSVCVIRKRGHPDRNHIIHNSILFWLRALHALDFHSNRSRRAVARIYAETMSDSPPVSLNRFGHALSAEHWKRFDRFDREANAVRGVVHCTEDCAARSIQGEAAWGPDEHGRLQLRMTSADAPAFHSTVLFEGAELKRLMENQDIQEREQQQGTLSFQEQRMRMRVVNGVLRVWDTISLTTEGEPVTWVETTVPAPLPFMETGSLWKLKEEAER